MNLTKVGFFAFLLFLFPLCGCYNADTNQGGNQQGNSGNNDVIPAVQAVQARFGSLPLSERVTGNVRAVNQVTLNPEVASVIADVKVQNGQHVNKGDILLLLRDDQFKDQLNQAQAGLKINEARLKQSEARLNEVQSQFNRIKSLFDKGLSSALELESVQAQLSAAQADKELVEAQLDQSKSLVEERKEVLSRTVLRAPISGTVGTRNAEVGMQVNTNTQLFTIGNLDRLIVEIILSEKILPKVSKGQNVVVYATDNQGQVVSQTVKISRISPFLNNITRSTEAEIEIDNASGLLNPGMFVPVDVQYGESQQATLIPKSALYTMPQTGQQGVYVARSIGSEIIPEPSENPDQELQPLTEPVQVEFVPLNVVARGRMDLGVEGINPGDWIVTLGQELLAAGKKTARVRAVDWDRVIALQQMKRQDLLESILESQDKNKEKL